MITMTAADEARLLQKAGEQASIAGREMALSGGGQLDLDRIIMLSRNNLKKKNIFQSSYRKHC
jgi:hypothetical protein